MGNDLRQDCPRRSPSGFIPPIRGRIDSPRTTWPISTYVMGFFDRLLGKKQTRRRSQSATPVPDSTPPPPDAESTPTSTESGPIAPKLAVALEQLELRNLDEAKVIYEEVLESTAGDRPDVLVRISGDLGATGNLEAVVELIAPRFDAERHGPATGINLLQAYIGLRNVEAAQHVLDVLFALKVPALEQRLWGFSNAIGELMTSRKLNARSGDGGAAKHINLVSISKPIWSYGIEDVPGLLPVKGDDVKRIAFAQLAQPGLKHADEIAKRPEDDLGRLIRGLPLWFAETLYFSQQYATLAAVGLVEQDHYALFPGEWTADNIRQLIDTAGTPLDYVMTGTLNEHDGDYALVLRLWEVKTFRERKTFEAKWTPATAESALTKLHEQVRFFFEWQQAAESMTYEPPASPTAWINTLAVSLSTFLADKGVLPVAQLNIPPIAGRPELTKESESLCHLTQQDRLDRLNPGSDRTEASLAATPLVEQAQAALA